MHLSRLRPGELVCGLAALALLVTLFLGWHRDLDRDRAAVAAGSAAVSGWGSLGVVTLALVLLAIGAAFALVFTTVTKRPAALPVAAALITTGIGIVVTIVLTVRVLFLDEPLVGAYLGLLLMLLVPVGSWIATADERMDAPYSAAPDLPRRPAPPAGV